MDAELIARWNSVVKPADTVYHLGDFAFGRAAKNIESVYNILEVLNGNKHLILGNHDNAKIAGLPQWESVAHMKDIKVENQKITLCHYAMRVWKHSNRGSWALFGHSHNKLKENDSLSFDIGVDCWDYYPVSFEQVRKRMEPKIAKWK